MDYDKFGHCIMTGERLFENRVINGKEEMFFKPSMAHVTFLLNDDSLMRVCMSRKSKEALTGTDEETKEIMNRVFRGWEFEANSLVKNEKKPEWTEDKAKEYLDEYKKKDILARIDDLPVRALEGIDREIAKIKAQKIKELKARAKDGSSK